MTRKTITKKITHDILFVIIGIVWMLLLKWLLDQTKEKAGSTSILIENLSVMLLCLLKTSFYFKYVLELIFRTVKISDFDFSQFLIFIFYVFALLHLSFN